MFNGETIEHISCDYKEYRLLDGKWVRYDTAKYDMNSFVLENMLEASTYFASLGGSFNTEYGQNRRFGLVPTKLVSTSICGIIRKVYILNYNQAQVVS